MKKLTAILLVLSLLALNACSLGRDGSAASGRQAAEGESGQTGADASSAQPDGVPVTEPVTEPPKEVDRTAEEVYAQHEELTPVNYDSPALLPKCDDKGQEYIDSIVFVCDSPTYWLKLYGLLSDGYNTKQVWTGPEGTMTLGYLDGFKILDPNDGAERTIPETAALRRPERVLITIGINGVGLWTEEERFVAEYKKLIDWIRTASPDTEIILQSILPISPAYRGWGKITNATITRANSWILKTAEEYGLGYLDSFSVLVGEDGNIQKELVQKDGLHPNKDGLTKVLEYIRTHG